jgi:hypothetical protein
MANLLSTNVSGRLYASGYVDTNVNGAAFRFYDGTTFRGGLGLDDWAHSGSAADITMYVAGAGTFYITTNSIKRHWFNAGEVAFRTYAADLNYKTSFIGGDQLNTYYGAGSATLYVQYHNGSGGNFNVGAGKLTVDTAGTVIASGSLRAPIFYDSNDTTYYLDPNSSTSGYFAGTLRQNVGKYVRDSYYRTISGYGDYYSGGNAGWTRVAEIRLTSNCSGAVLYGTLYDHRYDGADAYQISIVARAECDFTSNNESHYINVGCTITGSTAYSNYRDKIRVLLIESSAGSRTYEVQFYETNWNHNTWQLESNGWTVLSSAQAPGASVGGERVNYISNQNADNVRANSAVYSPIYYDSNNTSYYLDPNSITSIRTVGSWRADASAWDGEFSGKMQYHSNHWYIQAADLFIYRNAGGSNVFTINQSGDAQANGSMRAPIFYDSADTAYYLDPNGNSVLTTATFTTNGSSTITLTSAGTNASMIKAGAGDELYLGGNDTWQMRFNSGNVLMDNGGYLQNNQSLRAPIFYDSDDTGFYVDPNGTSNLRKFSEFTMAYNGMNPRSANSPYVDRYNGSAGYRNGTMGFANTDFNVIARNWGSGFIDTWSSPANAPGSSSHYIGLQGVHYSDGGTSFYGFQMACAGEADNRFFWRSSWPNMRSWVEMIHSGNIASQSVSYADESGYSSSAGTTNNIEGLQFRNTGSNAGTNADTIDSNGITYYTSGVSNFSGNATDGALYSQRYSNSWQHQIAGDYRSGQIALRGRNNGTWQDWRTVLDDKNIGSYAVPYGNMTSSTGLNDNKLYLRTNGDNNHYLWNAADDWEELVYYTGTGFRIKGSTGVVAGYFTDSEVKLNTRLTVGNFPNSITNTGEAWVGRANDRNTGTLTVQLGGNSASSRSFEVVDYAWSTVLFSVNSNNTVSVNNYLEAGSSLRAPIFYDSNDTTYYLDPNGSISGIFAGSVGINNTSPINTAWGSASTTKQLSIDGTNYAVINLLGGSRRFSMGVGDAQFYMCYDNTAGRHNITVNSSGSVSIPVDVRSPIFYDSADTNYYVDPNSESRLYRINVGGGNHTLENTDAVIKFRNTVTNHNYIVSNGLAFDSWNQWIRYVDDYNTWRIGTYDAARESGTSVWRLAGRNRGGNSELNYIVAGPRGAWGSDDRVILHNPYARYDGGSFNGDGTLYKIIDASNIGSQSVNYASSAGNADTVDSLHASVFVRNDTYNSADAGLQVFRNIGTIDGSWPSSDHTFGLENSDAGNIVVNFHRGGYTSNNLWYNGSQFRFDTVVSSTSDFRAPIFYDSNNTGYYGDFASTSVMNAIRFGTSTNNGTLSGSSDWGVRVTTDGGYIQLGPANGSWAHIYSGLPFYFNQDLYVNGTRVVLNSGTWGISITGSAASAGNADTVDSLHASSFVRRDTTNQYLKPYYEYTQYLTTERPIDLVDQMGGGGLRVDFMGTSYTADGNWGHVITWSGYNGYTMYQLSGSYGPGVGAELYIRNETNHARTSWSSWRRLLNNSTDVYAANMNQYVRTTDDVTFNTTTAPTILVNNHSDNTRGYRIHNTSGSSVSAMFTNSANALVIGAGAFDQVQLNKKVLVSGAALGVNVAASATAGRIDASNDIVAYSSSDERLKHNITPIENAIDKVKSLTGVEFDWKPEYKHAHGYEGHDTGIIAQQVQEVIPSAVRTNDTGFLAVRYEKLIGLLVEGMKEQQAQINELKAKLDGLTK